MERFRVTLHDKLTTRSGTKVHSELLFPYGDWKRNVIRQVWEIRKDMSLNFSRISQSIGGNRVLSSLDLNRSVNHERRILLLGHSGGGVAAVHAAQLLLEKEICQQPCSVVMIGSPRIRIPTSLKQSVLALHGVGKSRDVVSRLGSFGGWTVRGKQRYPVWHTEKHAPGTQLGLSLIGGHPDYFRDHKPFINEAGKSNMDILLETIMEWLFLDSTK
jgi:alpha-beta hydrolase superfamily lysophospholipase